MKTRIMKLFSIFMSVLMLVSAVIPAQAETTVDASALEEAILAQAHGDTADGSEHDHEHDVVEDDPVELAASDEATEADDEVVELFATYSGAFGTNLTWTLDTTTGVLTISGTGAMTNWSSYSSVPWYSYRSSIKSVVIGDSVTSISDRAFSNCSSLTSVTIPDSVTSIGSSAFYNCTSLTSVVIPDSVTSIGSWAFYNCDSLTSVTIGNSVTSISYEAFYSCNSLTSITVDEKNTKYSSDERGVLFNKDKTTLIRYPIGNTNTSYTIPDSVTSIGEWAFEGCTKLTSVSIGDSVTSISDRAFSNCSSLTSVTILDSVTSIGSEAFCSCYSLTSVDIGNSVTSIGSSAFYYCTSLTSVDIGDSITTIGTCAFYYCTSLTSVDIPDSVTSIGEGAFSYCTSLTSVSIGDSVTFIGSSAFSYCTSLTSVDIGNSVTSIGSSAFYYCMSLTSVTIPDSVTSIGSNAFDGCYSLTSVTIPDSVTSIGSYAFYICRSLTSITVEENNTKYSSDERGVLFNKDKTTLIQYPIGNTNTSYTIPDSVTSIGDYAFRECSSLTSVDIGDSVTSIGSSAFRECSSLTSVDIGDSVTSIGSSAFSYCTSLTSVDIGNSVTSTGSSAFYYCMSLTSVSIGDSVTSIGDNAFYRCNSLTSVIIPNSVTSIGNSAFYGCSSLTDVYYAGTEDEWNAIIINSRNDPLLNATVHFNYVPVEIIASGTCGDNLTWTLDENGVLTISGTGAMYDWTSDSSAPWYSYRSSIKTVVIESGVTSVGAYAFYNCTNMTSASIGDDVTSIGNYALYNCKGMTSVTIGDSVASVGSNAFGYCESLTSITIPASVTSIGSRAFYYCSGITSITLPDSVTTLEDRAFYYCTSLTTVSLSESITSIPDYAFAYCESLDEITIGVDALTSIGNNAFYNCSGMKKAVITNRTVSIGSYAFSGCHADFAIHGYLNSTAHTYAKNNDIPFVALDACVTHTYSEWVIDSEATCTEPGSKHSVCSVCGEGEITAYIPALGHDWSSVVTKEPTCTDTGLITYTCANCNDSYNVVTYSEHDYTSVITPATCTVDGSVVYTCSKCSDSYTEVITASHDYVISNITRPTADSEGAVTYTCSKCSDSYAVTIPSLGDGGHVLLLQDRLPWTHNDNVDLLNSLVDSGYINGWDIATTDNFTSFDYLSYDVILIANDQTSTMYDNLGGLTDELTAYANAGGVVIYGACDEGWTDGAINFALPGGVSVIDHYALRNYIVDSDHAIVLGAMTNNRALTDGLLDGTYCSHTSFEKSSLPADTNIILEDGYGRPTLVEYPLGDGYVIASGLTWEFYYSRDFKGDTTYSKNVFDDLVVYAISLSGIERCEHAYDEGVVTAPGCLTEGYTTHTCQLCGASYKDTYVPATGHIFGEWTVLGAATCTSYGKEYRECTQCGYGETAVINALGHDYEITASVEPTCTENGHIDFECKRDGCDATKVQIIEASGHDYGDDNVCDKCGHVIENHKHLLLTVITDPTCTSVGYTTYTCTCGYTYKADYIEQLGHKFDNGTVTTEATCTTDGVLTYDCERCNATMTEVIPAGHDWNETVITEATCTADGEMTRTCNDCGESETVIIKASHKWDAGTVTDEPDCTSEGKKTCTCSACLTTEEFTIPALGHHFVDGVCTRCGLGFIDTITPVEDHPVYGMYFEIDDIESNYGPSLIDEYGVLLDYNPDAKLEKVAVYLTQDGTMWRRAIACTGEDITYATYVPYLSYRSDIKYTGLNSDYINIFRLSKGTDGIWKYSNYATIGVNLADKYGNLLLSLYDIGQAGKETRIFDDLDEMKAWLGADECSHTWNSGVITTAATCTTAGFKLYTCTGCGETKQQGIAPLGHALGEWIVTVHPTDDTEGEKYRTCTRCDYMEEVTFPKYDCGDINRDGNVNALDSIFFQRFLAGWAGYTDLSLSLDIADIDADSAISGVDATILSRYLAGWGGYTEIPLGSEEDDGVVVGSVTNKVIIG